MADEFENGRERQEAYPTMDAYCQSRTADQLAQLIYDETHRANVFGTYDASNGQHAQSIIAAAARLSTQNPAIKTWAVLHSGHPAGIYASRDEAEFVSDLDNALCGKVASVSAVTITIDEVA